MTTIGLSAASSELCDFSLFSDEVEPDEASERVDGGGVSMLGGSMCEWRSSMESGQ